ncbi:MAG: metallophosphoesterase [Thermodesulfobacteriaceae bacterium]|nr:metallophosphoesterase [Thermodesulfobacteriaceae bacterium]MCX8041345.1 metallophosphoesterase [Thermodesulfobacteriaceae bacterium]MDW8136568.1 metallophosphoesterase [Thermodesulfobacterium sp.]
MLVAIMSDSHDHIDNLAQAVEIAKERGCVRIFHCGDLISPFMLPLLAHFEKRVDLILGNNRGDIVLLFQVLKDYPEIHFHGEVAFLEVENFKIVLTHYPYYAYAFASENRYDYVFFGHTHLYEVKEVGKTLVINPGEIMKRKGESSFVILDLTTRKFEKINLR